MNIEEIKRRTALSGFLEKCGHRPTGKSGDELMYHAPYRKDGRPSLAVNDGRAKWYDHGIAKGGGIIDLAMMVWGIQSVKEAVARINRMYPERGSGPADRRTGALGTAPARQAHEIVRVQPLGNNFAIVRYLQQRNVYEEARQSGLLKEVYYDHVAGNGGKKRYFGAGWQNESGGWEVRSKYGKTCISQKGILVRNGKSGTANVFEGMMDFLSAMAEKTASPEDTVIVLNGLAMCGRAAARLRETGPRETRLFLDNGTGGDRSTKMLMDEIPGAIDMRHLYNGHGDYNEKLCAENGRERGNGARKH